MSETERPPAREEDAAEVAGVSAALRRLTTWRELVTLAILVVVVLYFHCRTLTEPPRLWPPRLWPSVYLGTANISTILTSIYMEAIVAIGMTIVIVGGGFDLSVGSVLALAGLVTGVSLVHGIPITLSVVAGIMVGMACGLVNGVLVTRVGVSPLIATLGLMLIARGLVMLHIHAYGATTNFPASFVAIGSQSWGWISGVWTVLITLGLTVLGDVFLRNSRWLRQIYYVGGNERAARLSGINVATVRTVSYILCGVAAAIAGVLNAARFNAASYEAGQGLELQVISACVIGGASLAGGQGTVLGAFLGVLLVNCLRVGLTQLGIAPDWQYVGVGIALIVAVSLDITLIRRRRG